MQLKLGMQCTRFEANYSSCTSSTSENICSNSGGAQGEGKIAKPVKIYVATVEVLRKKERLQNLMVFLVSPLLNVNTIFAVFFFGNLTLFITKLMVLVLCFPYFMELNSKVLLLILHQFTRKKRLVARTLPVWYELKQYQLYYTN
jgi:hypothetical protein